MTHQTNSITSSFTLWVTFSCCLKTNLLMNPLSIFVTSLDRYVNGRLLTMLSASVIMVKSCGSVRMWSFVFSRTVDIWSSHHPCSASLLYDSIRRSDQNVGRLHYLFGTMHVLWYDCAASTQFYRCTFQQTLDNCIRIWRKNCSWEGFCLCREEVQLTWPVN